VGRGGRAEVWLAQQTAYDLWQARKSGAPAKVKRAPTELEHVAA
jgi:antitoxin HigA-1